MKFWLQTLAAKFLYRTGASVLINLEFNDDVTMKMSNGLIYGCNFHGKIYLNNGEEFQVPNGKFKHSNKGNKRNGR